MKKALSLLLSLIMVMTAFMAMPFGAKAATAVTPNITYHFDDRDKLDFKLPSNVLYAYEITEAKWVENGGYTFSNNAEYAEKDNYYWLLLKLNTLSSNYCFGSTMSFNGVELTYSATGSSKQPIDLPANSFAVHTESSYIYAKIEFNYADVINKQGVDTFGSGFYTIGERFDIGFGQIYAGTHFSAWDIFDSNNGQPVYSSLDPILKQEEITYQMDNYAVTMEAFFKNCTFERKVTKEPTCTENGEAAYYCTVCGAKKNNSTEPLQAKGHFWDEGFTTAPTFRKKGKTVYTCSECGETKTEIIPKLKKPQLTDVVAGKKRFTAKWGAVEDVLGFEIQYATNKEFTKNVAVVKVKNPKKVKKLVKKLKAKQTYYVRIRAYIDNGKIIYSGWSAKKTVKTK